MATCIALLRGINVGGRNRLAMADLRELCTQLGFGDVQTYVQSGNVVFTTDRDDLATIATELTEQLEYQLGVEPTVMIRTRDEFASVVANNPFVAEADADPTKVHAALLSAEPDDPTTLEFDPEAYAPEVIASGDRVRYLHVPSGLGRSRLATDLTKRRTGVEITVRNWRTVTNLLEMAEG